MVDIITSYDAAIFAVIMDKPDEPIIVPEHHLPKQYYLLLKKVDFYCNHHHYGKAMMIFDEVQEDADRKIAEAITGFLFKTKFGRSFQHILEMPLFVSSAVTPAVQFADIFAGIVRHYYENELDQKEPETEFQEWLVALFAKLHNLTENNFIPKSHYLEYGFQKIGKNFSYPVREKFTTSDNDENLLSEEFSNDLSEIIYVFLTIFLYLLKCPQSLILSALRAFCFCGKPHISRSIFLYFLYQTWLKSW